MKKTKQTRVQFANRHPDSAIEQRVERAVSTIYPTGAIVLFGQEQAYVMPTDWTQGPGLVVPYEGQIRQPTSADVQAAKTDNPGGLFDRLLG
jgi:antirestriction protein ArdC